jgi:hypothetical protein
MSLMDDNGVFLGLSERGTPGHRLQPESLEVFPSGTVVEWKVGRAEGAGIQFYGGGIEFSNGRKS